jgi:hypothetical protein
MDLTQPNPVLAFEPAPGQLGNSSPLVEELFAKRRFRSLTRLVFCSVGLAVGVIAYFTDGATVALPTFVVAYFGFVLFVTARHWVDAIRPTAKLLGEPFREVRPDEILVSGRTVSLRLPDGSPGWIVVRLKSAQRLQLAGQRRVWALGPGADGRVLVLLPGSVTGVIGRARPGAAPGSAPLPAQSREPSRPDEDPVLLARAADERRGNWTRLVGLLLYCAAYAWILVGAPGKVIIFLGSPFSTGFLTVYGGLALVAACVVVLGIPRIGRNLGGRWTELEVLVTRVELNSSTTAKVVGRATLSDGTQRTVTLPKADVDLAANVSATGRLWLIGAPKLDTTVKAGLPGYPPLGSARLTR